MDVEDVKDTQALEVLNLNDNPLSPRCHDLLSAITKIEILLSPREKEDWEDLTI